MTKPGGIIMNAFPIILMIGLVLFIPNDYVLTLVYIAIIVVAFSVQHQKNEFSVFAFGLLIMTFFEYLFISTGVEVFRRNSLFGVMPLWLPFLWGYGFVAIKRSALIIAR